MRKPFCILIVMLIFINTSICGYCASIESTIYDPAETGEYIVDHGYGFCYKWIKVSEFMLELNTHFGYDQEITDGIKKKLETLKKNIKLADSEGQRNHGKKCWGEIKNEREAAGIEEAKLIAKKYRLNVRDAYIKSHPELSEKIKDALLQEKVAFGMSMAEVVLSSGVPVNAELTYTADNSIWKILYVNQTNGLRRYVTLDNNKVTSIQIN